MRLGSVVGGVFLSVAVAVPATAQRVTGDLVGVVLAANGEPVVGASVMVMGPTIERALLTDGRGRIMVLALPVARYTVRLRAIGFAPRTMTDVDVRLGSTTSLGNVTMTAVTPLLEEIVVRAERLSIDPISASDATVISSELFEKLPTDRSYQSIVLLAPQANASSYQGDGINVAGATGPENAFFIDGLNVTDPWMAGSSPMLPMDFIREVQVRTGGYEAEFGRAQGGVINVITRSGGNQLHGQLFSYLTTDVLAGEPKLGAAEQNVAGFSRYDVGGSLSGPLLANRLWFFAAYDPSVSNRELVIPGVPNQRDRQVTHSFAGKLTWQPSSGTTADVVVIGDPGSWQRVAPGDRILGSPRSLLNPDPILGDIQQGGVSVGANIRSLIGRRLLVEAAVSRYTRRFVNQAATDRGRTDTLFADGTTAEWSGGYGFDITEHLGRNAASVAATVMLDAHTVKAGVQYEDNWQRETYIQDGVYRDGASSFLTFPGYWNGTYRNRIPTAYLQDSWAVTDRFRFNAGLRWEGQYFIGQNGKLVQQITGQWQPRLGFVSQEGANSRVFGSWGRFYEQLPLLLSSLYYTNSSLFINFFNQDPRVDTTSAGSLDLSTTILPELGGLRGQHYDEFTAGVEHIARDRVRFGVRGVYRHLREIVDDIQFLADSGRAIVGNPGRGPMAFLPRPIREYLALEFTLATASSGRVQGLASYVFSSNTGNYGGLFRAETGLGFPNQSYPDDGSSIAAGPLPNDVRHVVKLSGSYQVRPNLMAGLIFLFRTGTPVSELDGSPGQAAVFLGPRGSAGRTPALWDLNFRASYAPGWMALGAVRLRSVLDLYHIGSPRGVVEVDQYKLIAGQPNANFRRPLTYQPPMSARMGIVAEF